MVLKYVDRENNFTEIFNSKTGFYARSGIIENGKDTGVDPFKRNFPQLIDVGIMGHCKHGKSGLCMKSGVQCYQDGASIEIPNMKANEFRSIIEQCKGKTFQVALGGRGDVDQHENFEEILATCRENGIVPNFTTSGLEMTEEKAKICRKYTGAVAVSWYRSEHTARAIDTLMTAGVRTNIHYVLGNNSIDEAIKRLKEENFPKVNAIIFLLHKPVGMGKRDNVLSPTDERVKEFFEVVDTKKFPYKVGFDSCSCAGIVNFMKNIDRQSIDYCEGARYSCYIDAQMNMTPCSFANSDPAWAVSLKDVTIEEAWNSEPFERFRHKLQTACPGCEDRVSCGGGCPLIRGIALCNKLTNHHKS